ncbi:MAG: ribosome silencing factor [Flavobacteriales bacterium]|nr:ribosome silencing factor [Flavobacteriales bacterium]
MKKNSITSNSKELTQAVVKALEDKKAEDIVILNLSETDGAVCDYFVICHGTSTTHVNALADTVERMVKTNIHERPWHVEGKENCSWILLDYTNVVVHVFEKTMRDFYKLEELWADAQKTLIRENK